ncbi:hypothetical protein F5Y16DRAFT_141836 [Xylariaceae sp. FL0255]|nr:hypothetical protein F5Y16DRAFT_141836 [Xylariaceae sp. FL0255]
MPSNWQRWPPPQPEPSYVMAAPALVHYESPAHHQLPSSQPAMRSSFILEQPYTISPAANSNYAIHSEYVFNAYGPQAPTSFTPPVKHYSPERPHLNMDPANNHGLITPVGSSSPVSTAPLTRSPVIKAEPKSLATAKSSKIINPNTAEGQAEQAVFHTSIDQLMKVIQQKNDGAKVNTPISDQSPQVQAQVPVPTMSGLANTDIIKVEKAAVDAKDKPHACQRKKCHKRFTQLTHLTVHDRAHTGIRPHKCSFAGCGSYFSQKGNLRSHERRHRGENPFKCHFTGCQRAFPQKGNLAAHLETHSPKRPKFHCILNSCGKSFSSRGNLKSHQNHYHESELADLVKKFSHMDVATMSPQDLELWNYFLVVHKNSNKGIKGRGRDCRVQKISPPAHHVSIHSGLQSPPELQHASFPVPHGPPHSMGFSHFGLQRNDLAHDFLAARDPQTYAMYDTDQASISSGTMTPASSPGAMYHEHQRNLVYHERLY